MEQVTLSHNDTEKFAQRLAQGKKQTILCLYGDLGAGKTTFVRGFAKGLGIKGRIASPTFTFQRIYQGKQKLYHFDCYRIAGERDAEFLMREIGDALQKQDGVIAIEWAQKIAAFLPKNRTDIFIEYLDEKSRHIKISSL